MQDLSTSSHLDFLGCPSDAFYLLNISFLSMPIFLKTKWFPNSVGFVVYLCDKPLEKNLFLDNTASPNLLYSKQNCINTSSETFITSVSVAEVRTEAARINSFIFN
ncbi:hypothetical protein T03_15479 [Trichinella britovi]|uniref:Uncharacterized protein n=1 Tax=Trichinella britovi TaxID=45882 RepID=A0A0V1CB28_TRIBR|nr:hypothetical protein T03_15479 [Trichinella britovi]